MTDEERRQYYLVAQRKCDKASQEKYKAAGLCAQCGKKPRELDYTICSNCIKKTRANGKIYRLRLRLQAYEVYGGARCVCCGDEHLEFLTLDHINGGGTKHRKEIGAGDKLYRWLRDNNYPEGYRVMCFNCNYAVFRYGECPHQKPFEKR